MSTRPSTNRPLDLFIAGLPRAGTTMLANLLTAPPERLVLVEPGLTRGDPGAHLPMQFEEFPDCPSPEHMLRRGDESSEAHFWRVWGPIICGLRSWGVKEVNPLGYDDLLAKYQPRRVIVLVRDIRDAALSLAEKHTRSPIPGKGMDWATQRLIDASHALLRVRSAVPSDRVRVVRYEDFVRDPAERAALESWLDWPLAGRPDRHMESFGRAWEIERHAGQVSDRSVDRRSREPSEDARRYASEVVEQLAEFQRTFGYSARHAA
ncbi:MAG: sulfotransferase [Phycisphaerales bacterium]|nr:sulfotransferase [Phycisphaerales bacterium]